MCLIRLAAAAAAITSGTSPILFFPSFRLPPFVRSFVPLLSSQLAATFLSHPPHRSSSSSSPLLFFCDALLLFITTGHRSSSFRGAVRHVDVGGARRGEKKTS